MAMLQTISLIAQNDGAAAAAGGIMGLLFVFLYLAIIVLSIAGLWMTFTKAGQPGWAAIIPIYNIVVLLEVAQKPIWWVVLFLIPCVSIIVVIIVCLDVAKNFGKGAGFGIGLALLGFIFFPLLGFSDAKYQPVAGK